MDTQKTETEEEESDSDQADIENQDLEEEPMDEESEEESSEESDQSETNARLARPIRGKKSNEKTRTEKEQAAYNRALRIKMGKSGAQAASRRAIKQGKDACQRKLWNQDVSNSNS